MAQEKSLTEKITDWLDTQGYPLEMKVASKLMDPGFWTRHSVSYSDPEPPYKSREIDVVCTLDEPIGLVKINFVIEC